MQEQDNCCAICKLPFITTECIDHCHTSGKVRGILCRDCNAALGLVKDDVAILKQLIEYLGRKPIDVLPIIPVETKRQLYNYGKFKDVIITFEP